MMKKDKSVKVVQEKKLRKKQLALLKVIYRFRFASIPLLMTHEGQRHHESLRRRLDELVTLGLLARRTNNTYIIDRRPAEYTLTPAAIPVLRTMPGVGERELKQLYARATASERFVHRSLALLNIRNQLARLYSKERLNFATKPQLNIDEFDYLPTQLPDAFMTLDGETEQARHFFVDYFDDDISIGIHGRKISQYMRYEQSGDWQVTGLPFPTLLIVCESVSLRQRAERRTRYLAREYGTAVNVCLVDLPTLRSSEGESDAIPIELSKAGL